MKNNLFVICTLVMIASCTGGPICEGVGYNTAIDFSGYTANHGDVVIFSDWKRAVYPEEYGRNVFLENVDVDDLETTIDCEERGFHCSEDFQLEFISPRSITSNYPTVIEIQSSAASKANQSETITVLTIEYQDHIDSVHCPVNSFEASVEESE